MIYNADCLKIMKHISDEYVDMIYLDPPFFTQNFQSLSDIDGRKYEFSDKWNSLDEYLHYMGLRIQEMKRILKSTGSIFLHCDKYASHHLRILLDSIFGAENFKSEIIWTYKRWTNSKKGLLPAHQTIFYYTKGNDYKFNALYGDYSATTNIDQILQERKRNSEGKTVYKRNDIGNVVVAKEKKGVPLSDVWEIPFLNPKAKERTGYPTQKPIELLDRIIKISTDSGDCVLDPFCGSGTTLVSAYLLERRYIGIDINKDAVDLSKKRLENPCKTASNLLRIGEDAYKTKTEEELSILKQFKCDIVQRNKGIDAFLKKYYFGCPVAIKIQRSHETFLDSVHLLKYSIDKKGCSYGIMITYEKKWEQYGRLPDNILVLNRYDTQFEIILEERLKNISKNIITSSDGCKS